MEHTEIVKNCWNSFSGELGTGKVGPVLWENGVMTTGVVFVDHMYTVGASEEEADEELVGGLEEEADEELVGELEEEADEELVCGLEEEADEELVCGLEEEADEQLVLVEQRVDETGLVGGAEEVSDAVLEVGLEFPPCLAVSLYSSSASSDKHSSSVKSNSSSLPDIMGSSMSNSSKTSSVERQALLAKGSIATQQKILH